MILVTNDLSDFRRILKRRKLHPGIVFLGVVDFDLMDREAQQLMFEAALDTSEDNEPINEAIHVQLAVDDEGDWLMTPTRYPLSKS